jgi:hypothetical protein
LIRKTRYHLSGEEIYEKVVKYVEQQFTWDKEEHFEELIKTIRKKYNYRMNLHELRELFLMNMRDVI